MAVTLNQLSSFLAVAREGSVSAAAEKLYVTQPSISAAVSALSKEVGVDLTERVGRGVGLTAAGEAFRPYADEVLGLIQQGTAELALEWRRPVRQGEIQIRFAPEIGEVDCKLVSGQRKGVKLSYSRDKEGYLI